MTETEAENGAAERHEFRQFLDDYWVNSNCWCGWISADFISDGQARSAHRRHQERAVARCDATRNDAQCIYYGTHTLPHRAYDADRSEFTWQR